MLELPFEYTLQDQEEKTITTSSNNVSSVSFKIDKNFETIHYYATANATLKYNEDKNWDNGQVNTFSTNNITINQSFSSGKLNIQAKSTTNEKMFIRAKIVVPSQINCSVEGESDKWNLDSDGYYYYSSVVGENELVESISVDFNNNNLKENQEFNAVVIIEAMHPFYDENGQPYADWNSIGDNV